MADASPGAPSSNRNVMIVLSYLWLLALVPLLTEKDDKEVQWHAKHGLVLMVAELFIWIVFSIVLGPLGVLGCIAALLRTARVPPHGDGFVTVHMVLPLGGR